MFNHPTLYHQDRLWQVKRLALHQGHIERSILFQNHVVRLNVLNDVIGRHSAGSHDGFLAIEMGAELLAQSAQYLRKRSGFRHGERIGDQAIELREERIVFFVDGLDTDPHRRIDIRQS